jgi:putative SOS response-associated peptidase YedK
MGQPSQPIKTRRCLIPADGFFELKKVGKANQPYCVPAADDTPFAFAGLWERLSKGEREPIESCTILTTSANEVVKPYHDRMPMILSPGDYDAWLDPASALWIASCALLAGGDIDPFSLAGEHRTVVVASA